MTIESFDDFYTKQELTGWLSFFVRVGNKFDQINPILSDHVKGRKTYKIPKLELIEIIAKMLSNDTVLEAINQYFPEEIKEKLYWTPGFLEEGEFVDFAGRNNYAIDYSGVKMKGWCSIFKPEATRVSFYETLLDKVFFPSFIIDLLTKNLPKPQAYYLQATESFDTKDLFHFNVEKEIFSNISEIAYLLGSDLLKRGKKGTILPSALKKMQADYNIEEPYENSSHKKHLLVRSKVLTEYMESCKINELTVIQNEVLPFLKKIAIEVQQSKIFTILQLPNPFVNNYVRRQFNDKIQGQLINLFKTQPDAWIAIDDFIKTINIQRIYCSPTKSDRNIEINLKTQYSNTRYTLSPEEAISVLGVSTISSLIHFLSFFGLLEIYHDYEVPSVKSRDHYYNYTLELPFTNIHYFRLTELGKYCFNIKESYSAPETLNERAEIILDEQYLLIKLSKKDIRLQNVLTDFFKPLSETQFLFDEALFMKKINSEMAFEQKISRLKRILKPVSLTANWEKVFDDIRGRFNPFRINNQYKVIQIQKNNPELLFLLMNDPELKNLCLRAEKLHIIVANSKYNKFINRIKELGWHIDQ